MSSIIPGGFLRLARNLADLKDAAAARVNLGLGSAATSDAGAFAAADHDHAGTYSPVGHGHSAADVLPDAADGVGAVAMLEAATVDGVAIFGDTVAGAELQTLAGNPVATPSTWRCQGDSPAQGAQTIWQRIS